MGNVVVKDAAAVGPDPKAFMVKVPGFVPIPFAQIGLVKDRWRR